MLSQYTYILWAIHETQVMLLFILHIYINKLSSICDWPKRGTRVAVAGRTFDVTGGHQALQALGMVLPTCRRSNRWLVSAPAHYGSTMPISAASSTAA